MLVRSWPGVQSTRMLSGYAWQGALLDLYYDSAIVATAEPESTVQFKDVTRWWS
jgi:hypothetical protein